MFEDLHWIDSETQAVLDSLVESLPTVRMLLLVNYRPEYRHEWGNKSYYRQLQLDPLPPESVQEVLDALLGSAPDLARLKELLIDRAEGNPFFLEESVRTLVETKALTGERGAYSLARPLDAIQVPATVQTILAARIDRLSPEEKRLLQSAAVVGHEVPYVLLQAIAELPEDGLRRALVHLQAAEFLYETSLFPDLEYTFRHALTHEVAYGSLLQDRRRILHARIAGSIEALYADRAVEQIERLAHHAFRGEMWEQAVAAFRQAGAKAAARSANREAVACFEQALAALSHLPETRETLEHAIDLRFDLRTSFLPLGELEKGLEYVREAEALARTLDDPRRRGWALAYMSSNLWVTGRLTDAHVFAQSAQAIAETLGDPRLKALANMHRGTACFSSGDYRQATEFFRESMKSLARQHLTTAIGMYREMDMRFWLEQAEEELESVR